MKLDYIYLFPETWNLQKVTSVGSDFLLGFPPEFRGTVYVRKLSGNFFHFHYVKGSGILNDFFYVNRKFPERCSGITERYGIVFRKIPDYGTIVPEFSGKR